MAEKEYIEREAVLERIDDIWDCADMVFEPDDHCCRADDCASCKWAETKNAIRKIIAGFPAADVRPVAKARWDPNVPPRDLRPRCSVCGELQPQKTNFCPNCGADMRGESDV